MESNNKKVDPYKVLNISKNFTIEQLREAYKTMALKVHPDKGGSEYLFKLVTLCYKTLAKEYNNRNSDRQYNELKSDYKTYSSKSTVRIDPNNSSFNIDRFNKIFDENKVADNGYGDFLRNTPAVDEPERIIKKFTQESFNSEFEKHNSNHTQNKHIEKYREPEPLMASKKIAFTEIGQDHIDDYSGDNVSKKNLNFMDIRIAHTTSRIVDPKNVTQRKEYRTVDDFEADRSQISYHLNDEDREYYGKMKSLEDYKEKQRLRNIMKADRESAEKYDRLHKLLLNK